MRITLLGASGGIGQQVIQQALDAGHQVRAVVRDRARITTAHPRLEVCAGDVCDSAALAGWFQDQDTVISALGPRPGGPSDICSRSMAAVIAAMQASGCERLLAVSASGLEADPGDGPWTRWLFKPLLQRILKAHFDDLGRMEALIRASGLNWTIVRPPQLTDGPLTQRYRIAQHQSVRGGVRISRADVADFLLQAGPGRWSLGY